MPGKLSRKNAWRRKRAVVLARDAYTCAYCSNRFPPEKLTLDHVTPKCQGGTYHYANLVASCLKCQRMKDNKTLDQLNLPLHVKARLLPEYLNAKLAATPLAPVLDAVREGLYVSGPQHPTRSQ